jgi:Nif-specific regulatory protein
MMRTTAINNLDVSGKISILYSISQVLLEERLIRDIFRSTLKIISEKMDVLRGMLTIFNRKTGQIFTQDAFGLTDEEINRGIYWLGEGITGKVVESGEPIIVEKITEEPEFLNRASLKDKSAKSDVSFICVPIKTGAEVVGTLSVEYPLREQDHLFNDVKFLSIVASMIAQTVRLYQLKYEENQELQDENKRLTDKLKQKFHPSNIIGNSKAMRDVYRMIEKISSGNTTTLILGESGVGKELVANAIHYNSPRAEYPFIKFNCAALPESIIESELFGHEKGAFSDAINTKKGRFELANRGTIFLDEIGEISLSLQAKLLRVLQEREFERVGGVNSIHVDIRVIAATNRDLQELVKKGEFREDLYYRLNVFSITVPPLRERKTDILLLGNYFLDRMNKDNSKNIKRISTPAIDLLMGYHWPGNVRELENCIERGVILSDDDVIHSYNLPPTLQSAESSGTETGWGLKKRIKSIEYEMIVEALKNSGGNISEASNELKITERILRLRINKLKINSKNYRHKKK